MEESTQHRPTAYIIDLNGLPQDEDGIVTGEAFKQVYILSEKARVAVISDNSYVGMRTQLPLDTIGFLSRWGNEANIIVNGEKFPLWHKDVDKAALSKVKRQLRKVLKTVVDDPNTMMTESDGALVVLVPVDVMTEELDSAIFSILTQEDIKKVTEMTSITHDRYTIYSLTHNGVGANIWDYLEVLAQHFPVRRPTVINYRLPAFVTTAEIIKTDSPDDTLNALIAINESICNTLE